MKKTLLIVVLGGLSLASCKKDYSCACTVTSVTPEFVYQGVTVQNAQNVTSSSTSIINGKKSDVETSCTAQNSTVSVASSYANIGAGATTVTTVCSVL